MVEWEVLARLISRDFLLKVENPRVYKPVRAEELVTFIAQCLRQFG